MPKEKKIMVKVSKELPTPLVREINEVSETNRKRKEVEITAKTDSISAANKAKTNGSTIYIQRREGNDAANKTRSEGGVGNPKVQKYNNPHMYQPYEANTGEKDTYFRDELLEKEMPSPKKTYVKLAKK